MLKNSSISNVLIFGYKENRKTMKLLLNCTLGILTLVDSFTLQMILHKQIRALTHLEAPRPLQTLPQRQRVPANVARTQSSHVRAFITVPLGQPVY